MKKYKPRGKLKEGALLWNNTSHRIIKFIKYNGLHQAYVYDPMADLHFSINKANYRMATQKEIARGIAEMVTS